MNKLSQLREAAKAADEAGAFYGSAHERLEQIVLEDPPWIIALLDALEVAEDALTCVIEDMDGLAIPAEVDDALAKIAALKGES